MSNWAEMVALNAETGDAALNAEIGDAALNAKNCETMMDSNTKIENDGDSECRNWRCGSE